jgi:hypothetical protein
LFFVGLFLFSRNLDRPTTLLLAACVFSSVVMLALERANYDLAIFFVVACAVFALRKNAVLGTGLLYVGFVLKLYPALGAACLAREGRARALKLLGAFALLAAVYLLLTLENTLLMFQARSRGLTIIYGIDVLWRYAAAGSPTLGQILRAATYVALGVVLAGIVWADLRLPPCPEQDDEHVDAFRAGAAIYVGSFLLICNFDYRMVFLLFTLPQLHRWWRSPTPSLRWPAGITLGAVVASMWALAFANLASMFPHGPHVRTALDELANGIVFAGLLHLLVRSRPQWMRDLVRDAVAKLRSLFRRAPSSNAP